MLMFTGGGHPSAARLEEGSGHDFGVARRDAHQKTVALESPHHYSLVSVPSAFTSTSDFLPALLVQATSYMVSLPGLVKVSTVRSLPSPTLVRMAAVAAAGMESIVVSSSTTSSVPLVSTLKS